MPPNYTNSALISDFTGTLQAFGGAIPAGGWLGFSLVLATAAFRPGKQSWVVCGIWHCFGVSSQPSAGPTRAAAERETPAEQGGGRPDAIRAQMGEGLLGRGGGRPGAGRQSVVDRRPLMPIQERVMGFEPTHGSLGSYCLSTWLHPRAAHYKRRHTSSVEGAFRVFLHACRPE